MSEPTEFRLVYVTASNREEALRIARALVQERLAACANVLGDVTSLYWWEDKLQEDSEVVLIAKTRVKLVDSLIEKVREVHSYDCPCVVTLPIHEGLGEYLSWIEQETTGAG